jgi:anti-anti-sigma factor
MTLESSVQGRVAVVTIAGRMSTDSAAQFEALCQQRLADGLKCLVVDITDLEYLSSIGLRAFVSLAQTLHKTGGSFAVCGMHGRVKEIFDMVRLTSIFPIFDTVDRAVANLA